MEVTTLCMYFFLVFRIHTRVMVAVRSFFRHVSVYAQCTYCTSCHRFAVIRRVVIVFIKLHELAFRSI